jgi:hypothetical protein
MMVVTRLGSPKSWDEVPGKTVPNPTRPGGNGMIDYRDALEAYFLERVTSTL